ncbi:hypothetical protein [Paenibacillus durus]|uniref:ABC transporter permease n=1 Tax=Paenibacillus durus TaxID=44251 RepID=A0A089IPL4_PAEDU|nr:hypothetical protein [Paenibacillus durus]AIQ10994.1 hypothetical protein PDUR_02445 [Paenibacillus durus]
MQTLKDSWFMIRGDYRGDKLRILFQLLFSIVFMGYLGGLTGMVINDSIGNHERKVIADYLLLALTPLLGFTYCRQHAMKYWSGDTYTKMLAYHSSLPIPASVILCKRKLQSLTSFGLNGVLFFGLVYAISNHLRDDLSPLGYIVFALTWIGFGFLLTGLYIFIEFSCSGRTYFWFIMLMMLLAFGTAMLVKWAGGNLLLYSFACSKEWGLLSPLMWGTLLAGTLSVQLFSKWTIHKLKSRDLA